MKHITLFDTTTLYNNATLDLPNVSLTLDNMEVHYNPYIDYSKLYLTFTAFESGTFKFNGNSIDYSLDNGVTWTSLASDTDSPTVNVGDKIMWKAELTPNQWNGIGTFSSTGNYSVEGNSMSLLFGDNFVGQISLSGKDSAFLSLFSDSTKLVSAENISLPATTLATNCYDSMFYYCTSLTSAPELPATTLAEGCYSNMFQDCTSLITAPSVLPATTLAQSCYTGMFVNCTSLTTAPALPATTLTQSCYSSMFQGCTSLTTAPELPATTLSSSCYAYMFYGCTSLNNITCLATDISAERCTDNWVKNVASSGTFTKDASMEDWGTGDSGIPTNWTVENIGTPETRLVTKYNVTDTSSATTILNSSSNISEIEIDGVTLDNVVTRYTFSTTGEHIVKYTRTAVDGSVIGNDTFRDCSSLTSVTIPASITIIGGLAFRNCSNLTRITIPASVTTIGMSAFQDCSNLTSMTIPNSMRNIDSGAFAGCYSLTSVTIPNSVTSIGDYAFDSCYGLTSISVASDNSYYDSRNNCNAIIRTSSNTLIVGCKNTIIPNSVTSIGASAFYYCVGLTSVTIPNSVTSIGDEAFLYCSSLTTLTVQATTPPTLGSEALNNTNANLVIKVPSASVNAYKSASGWSNYASKIQAI